MKRSYLFLLCSRDIYCHVSLNNAWYMALKCKKKVLKLLTYSVVTGGKRVSVKYRYYRTQLSSEEQQIYDTAVKAMENCQNQFEIAYKPLETLRRVLYAVDLDHPELFYVDFRNIISKTIGNVCFLEPSYHIRNPQLKKAKQQIRDASDAIIKELNKAKPADPFLFLHDYLVKTAEYGEIEERRYDAHSIYGALIDHICVCEGFSKAYRYLCLLLSLQCIVVTGSAFFPGEAPGPHAWNMIRDQSHLYHVDVTFDRSAAHGCLSRSYYRLNEQQILQDHSFDPMFKIPDSKYNGSLLKTVSGTRELISFLRDESKQGRTFSQVRLTKGFKMAEIISKIESGLSVKDYGWYSRLDSYWYRDQARTISFIWKNEVSRTDSGSHCKK